MRKNTLSIQGDALPFKPVTISCCFRYAAVISECLKADTEHVTGQRTAHLILASEKAMGIAFALDFVLLQLYFLSFCGDVRYGYMEGQ